MDHKTYYLYLEKYVLYMVSLLSCCSTLRGFLLMKEQMHL